MTAFSLALHALTFTFTLWLGLYLVARAPKDKRLLFAGLGLIAYAEAIALAAFATVTASPLLSLLQRMLVFFPAICWTGTLIWLLPEDLKVKKQLYRFWLYSVLPMSVGLVVMTLLSPVFTQGTPFGLGVFLLAAISLIPLLITFVIALKHYRLIRPNQSLAFVFIATLFFALAVGALLLPLNVFSRSITMFGIGFDLVILGLSIAYFDAFDLGESLVPDIARSFIANSLINSAFAGQIAFVMVILGIQLPLLVLLFSSITLLSMFQAFSNPLQRLLDSLLFSQQPKLKQERADLRAASRAAIRSKTRSNLSELNKEDFAHLTRKALSNFSDLSKLGSSPLAKLPIILKRLDAKGLNDDTLSRAQELKQVLLESVLKLKPYTDLEFATTDEWRHYNVLFFPYIMGVKPFSQRADHSHLDTSAKEAVEYFRTYVPERTFYNWQKMAASAVATDLQEQLQSINV